MKPFTCVAFQYVDKCIVCMYMYGMYNVKVEKMAKINTQNTF